MLQHMKYLIRRILGLVFLKEKLVSKRRVPGKKESWKEEETEKKVKILAVRKILEVEEGPGDQRAAWEGMPGMLGGLMHNAQDL